MTTENSAQQGGQQTSASTTTQAGATQGSATQAAPPAGDPSWLPERLSRERNKATADVLKDLGVTDVDSAKKILSEAQARAEKEKGHEARASELDGKLKAEQAEKERLHKTVTEHAARMMVGLTAEQQKAVKDVAGDDPAAQLRAIGALAPTWAKKEEDAQAAAAKTGGATSATTTSTQTGPAAPPATTAPGRTAPSGATTSPPDHRAVYQDLRAKDPFAAARYGAEHTEVYQPKT